jgi:hypothetical protein
MRIIIEGNSEEVLAILLACGMHKSFPSADGAKSSSTKTELLVTENFSDNERKILEQAMEHTHKTGESPLLDAVTSGRLNRAETMRQFVKERGTVAFGDVVNAMAEKYPGVSRRQWYTNLHCMCSVNGSSYSFKRVSGKGKNALLALR